MHNQWIIWWPMNSKRWITYVIIIAKERKEINNLRTWSCYLKTKTMVIKGWPANTVFSSSVFIYSFSSLSSLSLCIFFLLFIHLYSPSSFLFFVCSLYPCFHFLCFLCVRLSYRQWQCRAGWLMLLSPILFLLVLCLYFLSFFFCSFLFCVFLPPSSLCFGLYRARECPFISPRIVWRLARFSCAWDKKGYPLLDC